ncbi:hemagglutinin repeat-containing protein [Pseudomonas cedrina]|uniref:hemagglutinin repeat-containing protein n=1 Tax=Pseudomonas cedrina TaxID=651740 RepID=UPI003EDA83B9
MANNRSKNSSEYNSATAKQSTLNAGQDLSIIATGAAAGTQGDIQITGSRLKAANTLLLAKNDVLMQSAQNTTDRKNEGSKTKTAIGASFNIGEQNGFTLDLGAQGAKNNGNGNSVTQVNSTLDTGSLLLQSGGDATLKGAQVRADRIKADIGGNLNIISLQDTESSRSKQNSAGFGASICVPPFCFGSTVAASANLAASKMNSDYKGVTDQSGLYAGTGGYDINVGKTTTLQGAVIASEASADKNRLSTDRLIVSDIKNKSEIESQSASISVSTSSGGGTSPGGAIPIALKDKDHSYTRSAVSEGTIVVRNAEGANDLVGLNRDTANANQKLDRPDEKAMQERIDLIQSSAQLASGVISAVGKAKADEAKTLADKAKNQTETGSPDAAGTVLAANAAYAEAKRWQVGGDKKLMADIATGLIAAGLGGAPVGTTVGIVANTASSDIFNKIGDYAHSRATDPKADAATRAAWAEGGAARVMLHALAGAAMGLSSGSVQSGALGAGASAALTPIVTDALKNTIVERQNRDAISVLIATGIGAGAGSGAGLSGAAVGGNSAAKVEMFNRQMHPAEVMALKTQVNALAAEARITTAEAEQRLARGLVYYVDATWNKVVGAHQDQPDPLTLKYLGIALAPLGDSYSKRVDMGDVPVIAGAKKTYTPDETVRLLQDYRVNNSGSYNKSEINEEYLVGKLDPVVNQQHDFYQKNLGYNSSLGALLEGAGTGIPQGLGEGAANTARGLWTLVTNFPDVSSRMANGLVAFVSGRGPEADIHDEAQGFLYLLQGDEVARARLAAKSSAEFALAMIPAGRAGAVGKVGGLAKGAEGAAEVGAATKASTGTPPFTSSKGPYSEGPFGDYPSGPVNFNGQAVEGAGDFGSGLGPKGVDAAVNDLAANPATSLRQSNGVALNPNLPDPVAGLDYIPKTLNSSNPNIANSQVNGYVGELNLANDIANLPNQAVVRYGDAIGTHGADVVSVNLATGRVTLRDNKYRSSAQNVPSSPTFTPGSNALDGAVSDAQTAIRNSNLPDSVKQQAIQSLRDGNFNANTVGSGAAKNSTPVRFCGNNPC